MNKEKGDGKRIIGNVIFWLAVGILIIVIGFIVNKLIKLKKKKKGLDVLKKIDDYIKQIKGESSETFARKKFIYAMKNSVNNET